jgi:hypothetical protein
VTDFQAFNAIFGRRTASGVRRVTSPLTVREAPARSAGTSALEPYSATRTRQEANGWLTPRGRTLLEDRGLVPPLSSSLSRAARLS